MRMIGCCWQTIVVLFIRLFIINFQIIYAIIEFTTTIQSKCNESRWLNDRLNNQIVTLHEEFLQTSTIFTSSLIDGHDRMLVIDDNDEIIIGARDAVMRIRLSDMALSEFINWNASEDDRALCQMKGYQLSACHNYVRTLILYDDNRLLICGTNAYKPECIWRMATNLSIDSGNQSYLNGVGIAPFSPTYRSAYLLTTDGDLLTGVATDSAEHDASIIRILPTHRLMQSDRANDRWLNDAQFVNAFESTKFAYFFFRETSIEHDQQCGNKIESRIARVCKNDIGNPHMFAPKTWTTFNKATLNCSSSSLSAGWHFDRLESVFRIGEFYFAIFTVSKFAYPLAISAICIFTESTIMTAFAGDYLYRPFGIGIYQHQHQQQWQRYANNNRYFDCEVADVESDNPGQTTRLLIDAKQYQLMADAVQPIDARPIHTSALERFVRITVDTIRLNNGSQAYMMFVLTESGLLHKLGTIIDTRSSFGIVCTIEIIQISDPNSIVQSMSSSGHFQLYKDHLLIGIDRALIKLPTSRCNRFITKQECAESYDSYCGWNERTNSCTRAPDGVTTLSYWTQSIMHRCPTMMRVTSTRSLKQKQQQLSNNWTGWYSCPMEENACLCRHRLCTNRTIKKHNCNDGVAIHIANCTRHGGWTMWNEWSSTCNCENGSTERTRQRECINPAPKHGGRVCIGVDTDTQSCPVCHTTTTTISVDQERWTSWGECSKKCGGGIQTRHRSDMSIEYRPCNNDDCESIRRWSEWTKWQITNITTKQLTRYRFACGARIDDARLLTVSDALQQDRLCNDGNCLLDIDGARDGGWSIWSAWNDVKSFNSDGNGGQLRTRTCTHPTMTIGGRDCIGHASELRQCNNHSCPATWTCWSGYSACSVTCGNNGVRHRVRHCPRGSNCPGSAVETIRCTAPMCSTDSKWTQWSTCGELGMRARFSTLYCITGDSDANVEIRRCRSGIQDDGAADTSKLVLTAIVSFIVGIAITFGVVCYSMMHRPAIKSKRSHHQSSNIYTSTPLQIMQQSTPLRSSIDLDIDGKTYAHNEFADFDELPTRCALEVIRSDTNSARVNFYNRDYR